VHWRRAGQSRTVTAIQLDTSKRGVFFLVAIQAMAEGGPVRVIAHPGVVDDCGSAPTESTKGD